MQPPAAAEILALYQDCIVISHGQGFLETLQPLLADISMLFCHSSFPEHVNIAGGPQLHEQML